MRKIDRTKKSNIKCEHCRHWEGFSSDRGRICLKKNEVKNYWYRCKEFEWPDERIYMRVWSEPDKKMIYDLREIDRRISYGKMEPMLALRIKDRKGIEIFEGDIVETPGNTLCEIVYSKLGCNIGFNFNIIAYSRNSFEPHFALPIWKEVVVVGHKYDDKFKGFFSDDFKEVLINKNRY